MPSTNHLTFRRFPDEAGATELTDILKQHTIDFSVEINKGILPVGYGDAPEEFLVKINQEDFEKAEKLLLEASAAQIEGVDPNHYLFDFTDAELTEILQKPDEWSQFDYLLAQKILKDRGHEVPTNLSEKLKDERLHQLAQPAPVNKALIVAGYVFSALGGIAGVFIGWYLKSTKKTLPNGKRVYAFDEPARNHGTNIFWIGVVIFGISFIARVFTRYLL